MSEEELSKEEKLEAARKKFEELKKKNKKGKKKGKKTSKTEEVDSTPEEGEILESSASQPLKVEKDDTNVDLKPEGETSTQDFEQTTEDNLQEKENVINSEATGSENEIPIETTIETDVDNKPETLETKQGVEKSFVIEDEINESNRSQEDQSHLQHGDQNETSDGIHKSEILKSDARQLGEMSQTQVNSSSVENEKIKEELKLLKSENLELKLTKIDTDLKIEELQNEVETYKKQVEHLTLQLKSLSNQHNNNEDNVSVFSEPGYLNHGTSSFQNLASFNLNNGSQDYMDIVDVKERLQQWKGWNMDMHGWRSIGMGPVVEF